MVSGEVVYCAQLSGPSVTKQVDLDLRFAAIGLASEASVSFLALVVRHLASFLNLKSPYTRLYSSKCLCYLKFVQNCLLYTKTINIAKPLIVSLKFFLVTH